LGVRGQDSDLNSKEREVKSSRKGRQRRFITVKCGGKRGDVPHPSKKKKKTGRGRKKKEYVPRGEKK